jgi:DNA-directed RNA polymerase subunit RPC12/RpoP
LSIFESVGTSPAGEAYPTGSMPGEGTYFCLLCGTQLTLWETDRLPECRNCGSARFRRDSMFSALQEHGSPTLEFAVSNEPESPGWLDAASEEVTEPGYHLATRERGKILSFHLGIGWARIGRCPTAEISLDDPSVSRRHAMIAIDSDKPPRILDDRSLNGILVNGERVGEAVLAHGDEIRLGEVSVRYLEIS